MANLNARDMTLMPISEKKFEGPQAACLGCAQGTTKLSH